MKRIIMLITAMAILSGTALLAKDRYALLKLNGSVNPIMAEYLADAMKRAQKDGVRFIVMQMDTPGGMVDSMREIIQGIMASDVPVVVYTFPKGARAASAGGYIMLSAHVAAMAPGTEIGAMHPVFPLGLFSGGEKDDGTGVEGKKVLNDMVAYARSLAQKRHRNVAWAERAVRDADSSSYQEALQQNVIDLVAEDMGDLLKKLDNRRVSIGGKDIIIKTGTCAPVEYSMDWKQKIINFFADPQMVLLLFVLAVVGIGIEIKSPGLIAPGVIGALSLFLFLLALRILPVNVAGLILIAVAVVLFILELKITSYGLLTIGGIASFVIGSMILFDSPLPGGSVPMATILSMVIVLLLFIFIVVRAVLRVHASGVTTGREGLIGETGTALTDFGGAEKGKIRAHGEIWDALCDEAVRRGEEVAVLEMTGMVLKVRKK